ncbi:AraC family transcriptional regulator [Clostridioides difficile]
MTKVLIADEEINYSMNINKKNDKEKFLKNWLMGKIKSCDIENDMAYYDITYNNSMGLIVIKPLVKNNFSDGNKWEIDLLSYAIYNISQEIMSMFKYLNTFVDSKKQIVILCDTNPIKDWHGVVNNLENTINKYLKVNVVICASFLRDDPLGINIVYKSLCNRLIDKSKKSNMLIEVQKYINRNYYNEDLSIIEIANYLGVSQTYLMRLFKRELKMTFIEYLTNVRIKNAIILMRDPALKLGEISTLVGYNTQHYFNNIFKRHVGISPQDYRLGISKENRV